MGRRLVLSLLPALALVAVAAPVGAQTNSAMAESLFRDGKKLLEERRFDEACPKFKESATLDPSSGVELALGLCYEGQGKTASAWGAYVTAASLARRDGRHDREQAANKHAAALESRLSHVTLVVAPETVSSAGLAVKQDGILVGSEAWKGAPTDPGTHSLEVSAQGKRTYTTTFLVGPGEQSTVNVPPLEILPTAGPGVTGTVYTPPSKLGRQVGFVVGAAGAVSLVTGVVLGLIALNDASSAHSACPSTGAAGPVRCGNTQGVSDNDTAGTLADWSTGTIVAGGIGVAAGAALIFFTGRSRETASPPPAAPATGVTVRPVLGLGFSGLAGSF